LGLALAAEPIELAKDVWEIQARQLVMALRLDPDRQRKIERIRLFVSEDRGKTWKHTNDYKPTDDRVSFTATEDGQYWFALQTIFKDGTSEPLQTDDLRAQQKIYVNTDHKALKVQKSYEELQRELAELRK